MKVFNKAFGMFLISLTGLIFHCVISGYPTDVWLTFSVLGFATGSSFIMWLDIGLKG